MPRRPSQPSRTNHLRRLHFEPLEQRRVLTTVVVDSLEDNTLDDGLTTFREAVKTAGVTRVEFDAALFSEGARTLFAEEFDADDTFDGKSWLVIDQSIEIVGPGAELLTIDVSTLDATPEENDGEGARHFWFDDGDNNTQQLVSIEGLRLVGGDAEGEGGAIYTAEHLSLNSIVAEDNHSDFFGSGGALNSDRGNVTITQSHFQGNSSSSNGGAIYVNHGVLTISDSTFSHNFSGSNGGAITLRSGSLDLSESEVNSNTSESNGGGLYITDSVVVITSSEINSNQTERDGGGVFVNDSEFSLYDSEVIGNDSIGTTGDGGGLNLDYSNSLIVESEIRSNTTMRHGGGIWSSQIINDGALTIRNSLVNNNQAGDQGGGLWVDVPEGDVVDALVLEGNQFDNNESANDGGGAYISLSHEQQVTIRGNSITRNDSSNGGGIMLNATGNSQLLVSDNIVALNRATGFGGGMFVRADESTVVIERSTIAMNEADYGNSGSGLGGGIFMQSGHLELAGSIVASNDLAMYPGSTANATFSLIGSNQGNTFAEAPIGSPDAGGNLVGGAVSGIIDPKLAPLDIYGGKLLTLPLLPDSPAIDLGDPLAISGVDGVPEYDLRGMPFDRVFDGNADSTARIDAGAMEIQSSPLGNVLVVDTNIDEIDGDFSEGDFSLREALAIANTSLGDFEIRFAEELAGSTLLITEGSLKITRDVEIVGLGSTYLTIEAHPSLSSSLLLIDDSRPPTIDVSISGLQFRHSSGAAQRGGAITNIENLSMSDVLFSDSVVGMFGGGIYHSTGRLEIVDGQFEGNSTGPPSSFQRGGAIYSLNGKVDLTRVRFENNSSAQGGAVYAELSDVTLHDVEMHYNSALERGGAIAATKSTLLVANSHVANNSVIGGRSSPGDWSGGGAIATESSNVSVTRSILTGNQVNTLGFNDARIRGGAIFANIGFEPAGGEITLIIEDSVISSNHVHNVNSHGSTAAGRGGGIATRGLTSVEITNSQIDSNVAAGGAGLQLTGATTEANIAGGSISNNQITTSAGIASIGAGLNATSLLSLVLNEVMLENNTTQTNGGGIALSSVSCFSIFDSVLRGNVAEFNGGSVYVSTDSISKPTDIEIFGTLFEGNTAQDGAAIFRRSNSSSADDFLFHIANSIFRHNKAITGSGEGGAIHFENIRIVGFEKTLEIADSIFSENQAISGGAIYATGVEIVIHGTELNRNTASQEGGSVFLSDGILQFAESTGSRSAAIDGGFLFLTFDSTANFAQSNIHSNFATESGGAVYSGGGNLSEVMVDSSTLANNHAGNSGGAIYSTFVVEATQSTFSGNSAGASGGAIFANGATISESTIVGNNAGTSGGGIYLPDFNSINLSNSIVAGNYAGGSQQDLLGNSSINADFNLLGVVDGTITGANNLIGVDPLLGPLANNGGPTPTHALLPGSPALDAGDPSIVFSETEFDQRGEGFYRVAQGNDVPEAYVDIGAYESQGVPIDFPLGDYNHDGITDAADYVLWRNTLGSTTELAADGDGSGTIDMGDYTLWKANFGSTEVILETPPAAVTIASVAPDNSAAEAAFAGLDGEEDDVPEESEPARNSRSAGPRDNSLLLVARQRRESRRELDSHDDRDSRSGENEATEQVFRALGIELA